MDFEIIGDLRDIETFAVGKEIRELERMKRIYGPGRWRKRKALGRVKISNGAILLAELHWYEATGLGKKEFKIKRFI